MWIGVLCGLAAGALWGMVFIAPALLTAFSPLELALGRYTAYGAMALLLLSPKLTTLAHRLDRGDCIALLRHALAGNLVYYMLLAFGVKLAGVAPTSLIIGVLPITVTLLGRHDHGAVPLRQLALPLLVVAAGIACINLDVFLHARDTGRPLWQTVAGLACAAGALLCWTWYAVDNARYLKTNAHFSSAEWSALYGLATGIISVAVGSVAFALWHQDVTGAAGAASGRDWGLFWTCNAVLALGASVIGNQLWNVASRRVPVTLSGQLILFETLFALLYGFLYRQAWPRPLEAAAIALLVLGVMWSVRVHAAEDEIAPA
ncbi:drug/metabolite transporter (DMT)-like permease [Pseudoduganella flava]|uniref:Drug/metabolite transporter (DMT)-like permease n=1 Tax=Pseudoduganella flava TaxID=871742 RepID=A0A562PGX4_9BURK|nr:DMT family transporter [Pseudoduganella flava]QGZ42543.1 EamA family transporter [Pseudoduganella flava]TWI43694.1 drug/metabolite transporter (DMT)-like permease [Pseudoduganella flava]